jgi:hypothetical protein
MEDGGMGVVRASSEPRGTKNKVAEEAFRVMVWVFIFVLL